MRLTSRVPGGIAGPQIVGSSARTSRRRIGGLRGQAIS
jgi:allophanate hydrolase subunit 2